MTEQNTASTDMRAVVQDSFGGPDVLHLQEWPRPEPLPTEVLVRVHAAGINPVDWKTRAGQGMAGVLGEPPFILGWDVAGVVEQVGFGVTTLRPGDEVYGMPWFPRAASAYAEFVTAPARQFTRKPSTLTMPEAAAVPLAALTAWQTLVDTAGLRAGQRVLITAAAGGVGQFAVQFARHLGADVIATARSVHHDWLRELGAARVVDYTTDRFEDVIDDVDVVLELVGDADDTAVRSVSTLRPGGLLIAVPAGVSAEVQREADRRGVRTSAYLVEPDAPALARISELIDAGDVRVDLGETFPLADVAAAHLAGEKGGTRGKSVLIVDDTITDFVRGASQAED